MIRTDIDIKDALYSWLKTSNLVTKVINGKLYKDARPLNSEVEDVTIAILARDAGPQHQEAIANINIYVPDIRRGQEVIENTARLRTIATEAASLMEYHRVSDGIFSLESQEIMPANGIDWHVINNRLRIRFNNE